MHSATRYVLLAIALCVSGIVLLQLVALSATEARNVTSGFPTVYTAARLWLSGSRGSNLQDWDWFRARVAELGFTSTDVFWGNPPSLSLLLVPLAWLSPPRARVAWTIVSLLAWFAGAEWLRRTVAPGRDRVGSWVAALSIASLAALYDPFKANLHLAQIYSFLSFLLCATSALWLRGRPLGAGVFLGTALALKGYGVPFVALALLRRERRLLVGMATSFALLAGLATIRLGLNCWPDFVAVHVWDRTFSGTTVPALQTIRSFVGVAMLPAYNPGPSPPVLGRTADIALSFLSVAVQVTLVLWLAYGRSRMRRTVGLGAEVLSPTPYALAACVAATLIFSPHAENHAYCLALAGILLMLPAVGRVGMVSVGTVTSCLLLGWPFHFQTKPVLSTLDLVTAYPRLWGAVLLLIVAVVAHSFEQKRRQQPGTRAPHVGFGPASIMGLSVFLFYLNPHTPARTPLLLVSRPAANAISCFRLDDDAFEAAVIPVSCKGPFGIALGPDRRWLYATCTDNSKLSVIDLQEHRENRVLDTPKYPAWATVRPRVPELWISNEATGTVTIYEMPTANVLAEVQTGNGPSDVCFTADGRTAFVTNEASGTVSWIDATARKKVRDIAVGKVPQGAALTLDGRTLVVANYGSDAVSVIDVREQREVARIDTGRGPVHVAVSPGRGHLAFVSCFEDGVITTLDLKHLREVNRLFVGTHVFGIGIDAARKRIYACSAGTDEVVILRESAWPEVVRRIRVPGSPTLLRVVP